MNPSSLLQRLSDGMQVGEGLDVTYPPCDYIPYSVEHLDEDRDGDRYVLTNFTHFSMQSQSTLYLNAFSSSVLWKTVQTVAVL